MQVRCVEAISNEELCSAWQRCFIDYAMSATSDQLLAMFRRRGYRPVHSFGAFDENEQLISFTLNGIGEHDGVLTVYDTSTGTDKNFRQQGLAKRVFEHSLPVLRSHGAKQYLLEVLNHNDAAISLYKKLGFSISREFIFMRQAVEAVSQRLDEKPAFRLQDISFREIKLPEVSELQAMWDFAPSWQNSYESMQRSEHTLLIIGAYRDSVLLGYGIVEPSTGDLPQLAVARPHRRRGLGRQLLRVLLELLQSCAAAAPIVKVVNIPTTAVEALGFWEDTGLEVAGGQYEMKLPLV